MQIKSPMPVSYGEGRLTIEMKARDLTGPSILPYPFEARYAGCAEITRSRGGEERLFRQRKMDAPCRGTSMGVHPGRTLAYSAQSVFR
jgi:hypothetical protein